MLPAKVLGEMDCDTLDTQLQKLLFKWQEIFVESILIDFLIN